MLRTRREVLAALALAPGLAGARAVQEDERRPLPLAATLILVRHTEKASNDDRDPDLSEAGRARAEAFAQMFAHAGVTGLVHSGLKRTRDTLAPLADRLEIDMEEIGVRDFRRTLSRVSNAKADEVIVVAGHSNTIPALAYAFGVVLPDLTTRRDAPHGDLPHDAYDRIHVLTPGDDAARLLELRYG